MSRSWRSDDQASFRKKKIAFSRWLEAFELGGEKSTDIYIGIASAIAEGSFTDWKTLSKTIYRITPTEEFAFLCLDKLKRLASGQY
ncbi:MAG TPA: hypothetical protein VJH95_01275 [Candidatus Nanoarchaeia archaeon]|nr:hypothetical protein [Candidatus Nanoarchaeia archaeon]